MKKQTEKANMRKQKENKLEEEVINLTRSLTKSDPIEQLLRLLDSKNRRYRRPEAVNNK